MITLWQSSLNGSGKWLLKENETLHVSFSFGGEGGIYHHPLAENSFWNLRINKKRDCTVSFFIWRGGRDLNPRPSIPRNPLSRRAH